MEISERIFQVCAYQYKVQDSNIEEGKVAQIHLRWNSCKYKCGRILFEAENLDYDAEITYENLKEQNGTVQFQLKLVRKFGRCLVETILPTTLLVLVSSVRAKWYKLIGNSIYKMKCFSVPN